MISNPVCVPRCIVAGLWMAKDPRYRYRQWYRNPNTNRQLEEAVQELCTDAGIDMRKACGVPELEKLQTVLNRKYQQKRIVLYDLECSMQIVFAGRTPNRPRACNNINLAIYNQHCYLVRNIRTFLAKRKQCTECGKVYMRVHTCKLLCHVCREKECDRGVRPDKTRMSPIHCSECDRWFLSEKCHNNHKLNGICDKHARCPDCAKTVLRSQLEDRSHAEQCGSKRCGNCKQAVSYNHLCYVQPVEPEKLASPEKFRTIAYDFETYTDNNGVHKPYLACAIRSCEMCMENENFQEPCNNCGVREFEFWGLDCCDKFSRWLFFDEVC